MVAGAPLRRAIALAVMLLVVPAPVHAQQVERSFAVALVRDTLAALDQANRTGNYTVLRDLGTTQFRAENDATDLSVVFAALRDRRLNLLRATVIEPVLGSATTSQDQTVMRLAGHVPANDGAFSFDIELVIESGFWRIAALSVAPYVPPDATQ